MLHGGRPGLGGARPGPDADGRVRVPRSLDPAYASDRTSANLVWNLMDPLVRLDPALEMRPAPASPMDGTAPTTAAGRASSSVSDRIWTDGEP